MYVQLPLASAVVVPSVTVPSVRVTTAFGSPTPVSVGSEVPRSVALDPVSFFNALVRAGAALSSVKLVVTVEFCALAES